MDILPIRIMKMIKELHQRGYTLIYLYSGMSPSGMNWRYEIGQMKDGKWPAFPNWINTSIESEGETSWAKDNSTVASLSDGFQQHFKDRLIQNYKPTAYSKWYANLIESFEDGEILEFYADYEARHTKFLATAPGFNE